MVDGELLFCLAWEKEDASRSVMEVTQDIMKSVLNGIADYLEFTVESGEDFDGWLTTLDTNVRVNEENQIEYNYYEKPTTNNVVIRKTLAMSENPKMQCLSNDLVRINK